MISTYLPRLALTLSAPLLLSAVLSASPLELHVSPSGKAGASGSAIDPLPSLKEAANALKALPADKRADGVSILLSGGMHTLPEGVVFDESCSGSSNAPFVITGEPGSTPILSAGRPVSGSQLEPITDPSLAERLDPEAKAHIRQINLAKLGIPAIAPFREVFNGDWRPLQVVLGTNSLPISRWPKGEYGFTTMKSVTDNGDATHGGTFIYRDDRPSHWQKALAENELWLRGFWRVPWVINGAQVKAIDTNACTITFVKDVGGGIGSKYKKDAQGRRSGDGNDVRASHELITDAVDRLLRGIGPQFVELATYRWREHCGPLYDNDIGYRTVAEFEAWKERDPIRGFEEALRSEGAVDAAWLSATRDRISDEIDAAFDFAVRSPFPHASDRFADLYAGRETRS